MTTPRSLPCRLLVPAALGALFACGGSAAGPDVGTSSADQQGGGGGGAIITVTLNDAPTVVAMQGPSPLVAGEPGTISATAVDVDGDSIAYAWSTDCAGAFADAASAQTTFTLAAPPASHRCTLRVHLDDGRGGSGEGSLTLQAGDPFKLVIAPQIGLTAQDVAQAAPGQRVGLQVFATDPQDSPLQIRWSTSAGSVEGEDDGDGHGTAVWTAPACGGEPVTAWAMVTDGLAASARASFSLRVPCP